MESEQELQEQLQTINEAIQKLIKGERLTKVEVGSPAFRRIYEFSQVTLENLTNERNIIQQKLLDLTQTEPTYRTTAHYMTWRKT